ncbi:hypothetical protein WJX72_008710 [[Myrmecia] bisecta]|uniref:C3H1-type domain-containing protein n=1 Tax=[Myrmecia] bisecta TaxID=41462 RepID=A0AAW1PPZ4_9CHLO
MSLITLSGQLCYKRALSRKLVFYDLRFEVTTKSFDKAAQLMAAADCEASPTGIELLLKAGTQLADGSWEGLSQEQVLHWRAELKLGDCVQTSAEACSRAEDVVSSQRPCKFWLNTGVCLKGDMCKYAHSGPAGIPAVRQQWIDSRRRRRREAASDAGDPHGLNAQRKRQRAAVFVDWLLKTYGREFLNSGTGVLDIAGGRGDVSFQLQTVHGIRCTLVEPRPQKLSRTQHKELARIRMADKDTLAGLSLAPARDRGPHTNSNASLCGTLCKHIQAEFVRDMWSHGPHAALLQQCSLVVGLHPDQATDAIVDFALQFRKCFAVVPCCVFARQFTHRKLQNSCGELEPVVLYAHLVEYLRRKADAQIEYLPFEGMNQAVYLTPPNA